MACSRFEYVKDFERDDALLPGTYIVVRLDGRGFTKFTSEHGYAKPNDVRGLGLMNQAAADVMRDWGDAVLAYGESDEYSFVFPRRAAVFGRRAAKLATGIASQFAAAFVFHWPAYFPGVRLARPPSFDARCVVYPTLATICDYARWRQVDAHVNALHNEAFWALVTLGGLTPNAAYARLQKTLSDEKHELLHGTYGISYGRLPLLFRRGTTLLRARDAVRLWRDEGLQLDGLDVPELPVAAAGAASVVAPAAESAADTQEPSQVASLSAAAATNHDRHADEPTPEARRRAALPSIPTSAYAATAAVAGRGLDSRQWGVSARPADEGAGSGAVEADGTPDTAAPALPPAPFPLPAPVQLAVGVVMVFSDYNRSCARSSRRRPAAAAAGGDVTVTPAADGAAAHRGMFLEALLAPYD